ncbi:uncharacterized protein LOC142333036 [Lycorma delicatula]|uniref:uncharacterized protein LOC142333036 n=1 Tax=Lycorma delicatula TaxID=130591 RepID=UPI003F512784
MRIIIYVMSFFIISAEKTYDEKELFKSEKYSRHEKYPNLQKSCLTVKEDFGELGYIDYIYLKANGCRFPRIFGDTKLDKIKKHKYYEGDIILLKVYEKVIGDKENEIVQTVIDLLDAIPDKIIIKRGIINTEADSIVSGIDITKTEKVTVESETDIHSESNSIESETDIYSYTDISTSLPCNPMSPETSKYGDVEYVIMEGSYIYAYYTCEKELKKMKFQLSDEESEEKIIKKIDMPCTLRINTQNIMNDYAENVIPVSSMDKKKLKKEYIKFELRFSYICKFVDPLQTFVDKNILQYKILNFTVSGYQSKKRKCIGLTYCLKHQNTDKYDSNLEEHFLYKFGKTEIINKGT